MRTLTAETITELGLTFTRPGYLVKLAFGVTLYLSTMGDIATMSQTWVGSDVKISGLNQDGAKGSTGSIILGNRDGGYGALVLNEGVNGVAVTVWACYAGATATGDPVQIFSGVVDGADIGQEKVTLNLVQQNSSTLNCPRRFIEAPLFNFLMPEGKSVSIGGEVFILERK